MPTHETTHSPESAKTHLPGGASIHIFSSPLEAVLMARLISAALLTVLSGAWQASTLA